MNDKSTAGDLTPLSIELDDGRIVDVRAIRPGDAAASRAAIGRLADESRYMRFVPAGDQLTPSMRICAVDAVAGRDLEIVALARVASDTGEGWVVGGARYIANSASGYCEFAIAIDDDWQRSGLALRLMQELVRSARARGLKVMEGFVPKRNAVMCDLAARLGFEILARREGPGLLRASLDLRKPAALNPRSYRPHGGGRPRRSIEVGAKP